MPPADTSRVTRTAPQEKAWDENAAVVDAVGRVLKLFGDDRCCFASNYPVDVKDGWPAARLYPSLVALADKLALSDEQKRKLFAENAKRLYKAV